MIQNHSTFLMENSQARTERSISFPAKRGEIQDRYHFPLGLGLSTYRMKITPKQFQPTAIQQQKLKATIGEHVFNQKKLAKSWFYVDKILNAEQVKVVDELALEGVEIESKEGRYYPFAQAASQVVGLLGAERKGVLGIEYLFDDYLKGVDGAMHYSQNRLGQIHEVFENVEANDGTNLVLSLDARIQKLGWEVLEKAVDYHQAEQAAAIVLDVATGEVLAMLNYPSFDPNIPLKKVDSTTKNFAVTELFEPGSIIKPLVMSAVLSHHALDVEETIGIEKDGFLLGGHKIFDDQDHTEIKIKEIFQKSSNIAMVKLSQALPKGYLLNHLHQLGLFTPSYLSLTGESVGRHNSGNAIEIATMSYGYGLSVNLVAIARAFNIIANQGYDVGLHLLKDSTRPDPERILSKQVCTTLTTMMERVVKYGVSSKRASVDGVSAAGKSGTTRQLSDNGEYLQSYTSSFVGFAPAKSPKVVIAVMVKSPKKHGYYGGQVAAPIFSKLMKIALHYHQNQEGINVRNQRVLPYPAE
ncbi:penicillin-binding protein 2 [Gammaproteobacteria bacterium]|nr:penicillin-binding protein 2 [Gammaproteobacteria bacterium]